MSRFARRSRAHKRKSRLVRIQFSVVAVIILVILLTFFGAMTAVALVAFSWLEDLPDYNEPGAFDTSQPTRVYANDGTLIARLFLENREPIAKEAMSPYILQAIVAVEDERFFDHDGVDPQGIARAAVMTAMGSREGGSTITQQYIRQTILRDEAQDITLRRKFREAFLALEVEKYFSKEEILAMYLNTVYFGEGAHGIQAASLTYFGKPASDLDLAEAALLAGIPQRPNALNPYRNPENPELTLARRAHVLNRMFENDMITDEERREASESELVLSRIENPDQGIYDAHYFVAHVRRELQRRFTQAEVFSGGLSVYTTIDLDLQRAAEQAVWNGIGAAGPEGALVSIEADTGKVIAMVGGRSYEASNFNLATQALRQAGSSFKTFGLVAAIEAGMSPSFQVDASSPATIGTGRTPWIVNNSEGSGRGMMSLQRATMVSINTVYARIINEIGADKLVDSAERMGIRTPLQPYPSVVLGAQGVTVLDMASAYATLATGGIYHEPVYITKVIDRNDKEIYELEVEGERVLTPEVSWAVTRVLESVVTGGTATRARISGWQVAGKTGTSQRNRDVWFAGYTPVLSTAVWVGYTQEQTIVIRGSRAFGGTVSAPIWREFMLVALQNYEHRRFATAANPPYDNSRFNIPVAEEPDLAGLTLDEARALLDGFDIVVEEVYSDTIPAGRIVSASFSESRVTLRVSKGPDPSNTPSQTATPTP